MKRTKLTVKGSSPWNEDALIEHPSLGLYGVVDGATSLTKFAGNRGETGGYLASQVIAGHLHGLAADSAAELTPAEALLQANRALREAMIAHGIQVDRKEELWGACAVLIRIKEDRVEYAQAGDCMLTAIYEDGSIRSVTRDQLAHLDNETKRLWAEGVARGLRTNEELWTYVKPQIVGGRLSANTAQGYASLNGDPELARFLEAGTMNRIKLKALLLTSDGLYMPREQIYPGANADAAEVTRLVMQMGVDEYVRWLVQLEERDPQCLRYPRVKKSDDKTALFIEF
ncbi:PP2C family serine/threonine-protein phosphatase [Paenibacillaceae bacterium WGS1546]|uniref:PP2C family serine/threonine-protein phosphatase n=1 Tax=Cohnella sp. WGS1546 TaxID=3366810 RepID=UPI00372D15AA